MVADQEVVGIREPTIAPEELRRLVRAWFVRGDESALERIRQWAQFARKGEIVTATRHEPLLREILADPRL